MMPLLIFKENDYIYTIAIAAKTYKINGERLGELNRKPHKILFKR